MAAGSIAVLGRGGGRRWECVPRAEEVTCLGGRARRKRIVAGKGELPRLCEGDIWALQQRGARQRDDRAEGVACAAVLRVGALATRCGGRAAATASGTTRAHVRLSTHPRKRAIARGPSTHRVRDRTPRWRCRVVDGPVKAHEAAEVAGMTCALRLRKDESLWRWVHGVRRCKEMGRASIIRTQNDVNTTGRCTGLAGSSWVRARCSF
ncbi:hypothetical protein DFH09DRAFT_1276826 [Mycena vulgaris]|nr:hypothetical protein DFH09DRAFT_1276826 [Mycena vulgaris]